MTGRSPAALLLALLSLRVAWGMPETTERDSLPPRLSVTTSGTLSLTGGQTTIREDNPLLPQSQRRRSTPLLRQQTDMHATVRYGDRLSLDLDYNTDAGALTRQNRLRLNYSGQGYELLRSLQVGDITFRSRNPLVSTPGRLFGVTGDLWLGPLDLRLVASLERDHVRRIVVRGGRQVHPFEHSSSDYEANRHFFLSEFFASRYDEALAELPLVQSEVKILRVALWVEMPEGSAEGGRTTRVVASADLSLDGEHAPEGDAGEGVTVIPHARLLESDSYVINPRLGYISLLYPLGEQRRMAVSYEYLYRGQTYRVGTFEPDESGMVSAALLSDRDKSPHSPLWPLMMKNGYSIGLSDPSLVPEDLQVELLYREPSTDLPATVTRSGRPWSELMGWDTQDAQGRGGEPDGRFDFISEVTISPETGTLFVPKREPFASLPEGYPSFDLLYRESRTKAREQQDRDRFLIRGSVSSTSRQTVSLGTPLARGSVTAMQGGRQLLEGADYTIDYERGEMELRSDSDEAIEVSISEESQTSLKRRSLFGLDGELELLPDLKLGGTLLTYLEESDLERQRLGQEDLHNTMLGAHLTYDFTSQKAARRLAQLVRSDPQTPVSLRLRLAYARLLSGYNLSGGDRGTLLIDDFEEAGAVVDMTSSLGWQLAANPQEREGFRGHLAWFNVDPVLVREGEAAQPLHLRESPRLREDPLVREYRMEELFPRRESDLMGPQIVSMLNLSLYPDEPGPYTYRTDRWLPEGKLDQPEASWAAIVRPLEIHDFEQERITTIEVWLMDPFYSDPEAPAGLLTLDLGRFAEEIVPDEGLSFETDLPMRDTPYGRRSETIPSARVFAPEGLERQDVGLDGVDSEGEKRLFGTALEELAERLDGAVWMQGGITLPGSPFDDPAGDDYRFYLGDLWDRLEADVLLRYKYINGTEGNSLPGLEGGLERLRSDRPDTEDLDGDGIPEPSDSYFRYSIPVSEEALSPSGRWYAGEVVTDDGRGPAARWVKLSIPIRSYDETFGRRPVLQDISAVRLTLSHFDRPVHLRLASFRLISSPWAVFTSPIDPGTSPSDLTLRRHSLEEDSGRRPIPYVSPPGVVPERQRGRLSLVRSDEQSLVLSAPRLEPDRPTAVYRAINLDLRHYDEVSLYAHAEGEVKDGELELFVRFGSDYTANYYEYRHPLVVTPDRDYSEVPMGELQQLVWPEANHLRIDSKALTALKEERSRSGTGTATLPYDRGNLSICGYPSLGRITAVMIGLRNRSGRPLEAEVWVDELAVSGVDRLSGDAWMADLEGTLSDLGQLRLRVGHQSSGFGDLRSDVRLREPMAQSYLTLDATLDLGKLLPERWHLVAPVAYSLQRSGRTPKYDPLDTDALYRGDPTASESMGHLRLDGWHLEGDRTKGIAAFASDLLFSYDLTTGYRREPLIPDRQSRRMQSSLDYNHTGSRGSYFRLHSGWQRDYDRTLYAPSGEEGKGQTTLYHRWAWDRSLRLKWSPLRFASLILRSSTTALIDESPAVRREETPEDTRFRLFSSEILRSIASLGITDHYSGGYQLTLHTPALRPALLRPLYAGLSFTSGYDWSRGVESGDRFGGHEVGNSGRLELTLRYDPGKLPKRTGLMNHFGDLELQYRHSGGSTIPGYLPEAGKALGIGIYEREIAPSLSYMLLPMGYRSAIAREVDAGRLVEDPTISRLPSYFTGDDLTAQLHLRPLKGLRLDLSLAALHNRSHILSATEGGEILHTSGQLRLSTIGLRGNRTPQLLSRLSDGATTAAEAVNAFLSGYTPRGRLRDGLPSPLILMPNWDLTLDLVTLMPALGSSLTRFELKHRYRGSLELPDYRLASSDAEGKYDLNSLVATDRFDPLVGLDISLRDRLTLSGGLTFRRTHSLLLESLRLLEQEDRRIDLTARYRLSLPPLLDTRLPILSSVSSEIETAVSYAFTHTSLEEATIRTGTQSHIRGLDTHNLRLTLDYRLSQSLSLRGFWTEEIRRPLVTGYQYPYRKSSYGLMLLLSLRP